MKSIVHLVLLLVLCLPVMADGTPSLIPFTLGAGFGYMDPSGRLVIEPRFESAGPFTKEGLACVRVDGRFGYVRPDGSMAIPPQFEIANDFSEGKAVVQSGEAVYVIDTAGRKLFELAHSPSGVFRQDRLLVMKGDFFGFVDETGRLVIETRYKEGGESFSEGLAALRMDVRKDGKSDIYWSFVDRNGQEAMKRRFALALPFAEGLAPVMSTEPRSDGKRLWEYVDRTGRTVIPPRYNNAYPFSEGLARVAIIGADGVGRYGFIDRKGRLTIPARYDYASDFQEGLAAVQLNGKWGFVDRRGRAVIAPRFEFASAFTHGVAAVTIGASSGNAQQYVDRSGRSIQPGVPVERVETEVQKRERGK